MGAAREIIRYKKERGGRIFEVVIWLLSDPLPGSSHSYNYRMFCGLSNGSCLVLYDTMERLGLVENDKSGHFYVPWDEINACLRLVA